MSSFGFDLPPLADGISRDYLLWHRLCPIGRSADGRLRLAVGPGALRDGIDDLAQLYAADVEEVETSQSDLESLIERVSAGAAPQIEVAHADQDNDLEADVRDLANQPPVVRYVNLLVREAYDARASDVHLEATREGLTARFRLDGVLVPALEPPKALHHAIVSRIKILAELDIAERRRPQDGRIRVRLESRELDLRVSTVPTMHGESVVLRLLDRGGRPVGLDDLGMSHDVLQHLAGVVRRPHGMLLVTGPTGSGKTTTLYAALQARDASTEKIITVEDPIEYQLSRVTQVSVHRQIGVSFANVLRAILRQDPDVLMIGEMRDQETAEIAVQAAMTGHFVFSTLHTNDAIGAIPRLTDLGVPDYLVGATVEAIVAQRLVRRVCEHCRATYRPPPEQVATVSNRPVGEVRLVRGIGCSACRGTGYRGRLGIFEFLPLTDKIRDAVVAHKTRTELRALALELGMKPLREDGWQKAQLGLTTVEEVLRVTQD